MKDDKPKPGRKKIIDGIKKQIICTQKEFEEIKQLLKQIRNNENNN